MPIVGMYKIPDAHEVEVVEKAWDSYKIILNGKRITVHFDSVSFPLDVGQRIVVVSSLDRMRFFRPDEKGFLNDYPIVNEVLSHIRVRDLRAWDEIKGYLLLDSLYDSADVMMIARAQENVGALESVLHKFGVRVEEQKRYQDRKGSVGNLYRVIPSLRNKVQETKIELTPPSGLTLIIPIRGLVEPMGDGAGIKRGMLEYCVEHARFP